VARFPYHGYSLLPQRTNVRSPQRAVTLAGTPVRVTGILTLIVNGQSVVTVELPDTDVTLQNVLTNAQVSAGSTQLDGRFRLMAPGAGTYRVCWKSDAVGAGCGSRFTVGARDVALRTVPVPAQAGVVHGRVLYADARPCWLQDPFFKINLKTDVTLTPAGATTPFAATVANVQGEYAFTRVPAVRHNVRAECERSVGQLLVTPGATPAVANINYPNHAPRLAEMVAFEGGMPVWHASEGARLRVDSLVREPDGDSVEYLWRTIDGTGSLSGGDSPSQEWQLGPHAGMQAVYLLARDGRGGYEYKRFAIQSGLKELTFSGRAIDETTLQPVAGAQVEVGGVTGVTNAQGWFRVRVAPMAAPERYVLNIRHPQYGLISRVLDKESTGNTYELIRAQNTFHPPGAINVLDTGSSGPCGGDGKQTAGAVATPFRAIAKRGDRVVGGGLKTAATTREPEPCRHRGARILVPAGALVDANGNVPPGGVQSSIATLNPARRTLPGDYRAVDAGSSETELLSYGAVHANFRDAGGNKLNLRPGTTAEIRVPISDAQLPSAPPSIAIWSLDEKTGKWIEEGVGTKQNTADGWMYVGKTAHFSELNMDVAGNDPAQATCVRFELGSSLAGWTGLTLRAYVSYAGQFSQVKETALDSAQYHAVFRIPYAPPAPGPNTLRLELRGTYLGATVVLLDDIIATDSPRPKMTGTNLWPDGPDYSECGDAIVLEADPVTLPYYGDISATGRPAFLTGPFGQFLPEDGEQIATDYYDTIDPGGANYPTLETWWTGHGFAADGSGGTGIAQYLNFNDLGFGRDMNCRMNGADLACYVTNYGLPDQNLANADAAETHDLAKRAATVAMEYIASEPSDRRVRFYVYNGGDPATAGKLKFADLDGLGPKPVPHLCIVCHGGEYDLAANNVKYARFREFDLPSFKYSGGRSWDFAPAPDTLTFSEKTQFANLNKLVRDIAPGTSPIAPLINAWYTGGFGAGTAPIKPTPPAGWNGSAAQISGYHNVYAKSCRTCHIARDYDVAGNFYTFDSAADFQFTSGAVCDDPKLMPNAFVTYKNFWSDPLRVIEYASLTGGGTCD
jgi:hypothetical protein